MYNRIKIKETKQLFYTSFGKYMGKHRSTHGKKIKWINYPTKIKHIYVRLYADQEIAKVMIELQHKDEEIRGLFFEQFKQLKTAFENIAGKWNWNELSANDIKLPCSRIEVIKENVNIFDKNTWASVFRFYEENLIKFDIFWVEFKDVFKQLED